MERKNLLYWTLALAAIPLLGWWSYGLFDVDEGFYAAVTGEMNRLGQWITPLYNGQPWYEKPILLYWAAKPCLALFGSAFGLRLPSVLATFGTYAVVGLFGRKHLGEKAGAVSVLVLSSSLLVIAVGRMMLTDPLLLLFMTLAFLTFWESLVGEKRWRLLTAVCLGFAVLAKGPVAGVLFLPVAGWTFWREPQLRARFKGAWLGGAILFALVVSLWYLPAYLRDGQVFVQKFLIEQNIGRFSGGDEAHTLHGIAGIVFYLPILLVGFLPWSFLFPRAWITADGVASEDNSAALKRYLKTWCVVVFCFFTITGAKLPHYILPVAPALAMLVGTDLARRWDGESFKKRLIAPVVWLLSIAVLVQWIFHSWYFGAQVFGQELNSYQSEIHGLCRYVKSQAGPQDLVAEFQMGRQNADLGTGHIKLQETSLPSTLLYLDREVLETDLWSKLLAQKKTTWILTRWNRITANDLKLAGGRLSWVRTPVVQKAYRLYLLRPRD